jgi:hypothetical protein
LLSSFLIKQEGEDDVTADSRVDSNMEEEQDIESDFDDVIDSDTVSEDETM